MRFDTAVHSNHYDHNDNKNKIDWLGLKVSTEVLQKTPPLSTTGTFKSANVNVGEYTLGTLSHLLLPTPMSEYQCEIGLRRDVLIKL